MKMLFNDSSIHVNDSEFDLLRRPILRVIITVLVVTIILAGFIGNATIICIVVRNKKMRGNVTNLLIANLALSDIGLCVFSLPLQLYYQLTDHWIFGEGLCRVIFPAFIVPIYVSNFTILLIAYDRYRLILYPLSHQLTRFSAFVLIVVIISCTLLFSLPVYSNTTIHVINQTDINVYRHYCIETWPSQAGRQIYSVTSFLIQFCIPLCLTCILYFRLVVRLRNRTNHRISTSHRSHQKTNRVLLAIVCLFTVCWLPWNTFSLLTELNHGFVKGSHFKFVDLLLKAFAMSSSCVNPFLYCWLNDNFRKELQLGSISMTHYKLNTRGHNVRIQRTFQPKKMVSKCSTKDVIQFPGPGQALCLPDLHRKTHSQTLATAIAHRTSEGVLACRVNTSCSVLDSSDMSSNATSLASLGDAIVIPEQV